MPDNISALMGLNAQNPEEARMAQALRGQQGQGDYLSLSTLQPVAAMGRATSGRAAQGAKQAGAFKQARAAAEAKRVESETQRNFVQSQASTLAKARKQQFDIEEAGRASTRSLNDRKLNVLETKNKATAAHNIRSNDIKQFKADKTAENMANVFGLNVDKFAENMAENKFSRGMKKAEFEQGMAEFAATQQLDEAQLVAKVNQWGVKNGQSQQQIDAQIDQYGSTLGFKRDTLSARKEQWGAENVHADEALHLKQQHLAEQIQGAFADRQYKNKALAQQDSQFSQKYAADINQFAQKHGLNVDKLAADILADRNSEQIKRDALYFKLVGDTGIMDTKKRYIPKSQKAQEKFEKPAQVGADFSRLMGRFKDEYGGNWNEPEFVGDFQNWKARSLSGAATAGEKEQASFWSEFGRVWELAKRHEMFGGALTGTEVPKWAKTVPNVGMRPDQLRDIFGRMTEEFVRHGKKSAKMADIKGYDREYILEAYDWIDSSDAMLEGNYLSDREEGESGQSERQRRIAELRAKR